MAKYLLFVVRLTRVSILCWVYLPRSIVLFSLGVLDLSVFCFVIAAEDDIAAGSSGVSYYRQSSNGWVAFSIGGFNLKTEFDQPPIFCLSGF